MSGSSQPVVFIPIVVMICLARWLLIVFRADRHPYWRRDRHRPPVQPHDQAEGLPASGLRHAGSPASQFVRRNGELGSGWHQRISDRA
jgi:hypothetical protein